jgi:hypothetical protein
MAEADQSQSGKTYRQKLVAAVYNETPQVISMRRGGVGSLDESLSQAILRANPIIMFDNIRGKFDSQTLEALLTCNGPFSARVPHRGEVLVDTNRFCFQLTSNGIDTTPDLANRASIIRISKQPNEYRFKSYGEGDLLEHVKGNQPYYLGCVFEVIRHWHQGGKKRTTETEHDFREWTQTMDWIVQEIFDAAPLMDGHDSAKKRATQPSLNWLRQLAIALEAHGSLGEELSASEIVEFCCENDIELPVMGAIDDEDKARKRVGITLKGVFSKGDLVSVEQYQVRKREWDEYRDDKYDTYLAKGYTFTKGEEDPHKESNPHNPPQPSKLLLNSSSNFTESYKPCGACGDQGVR